MSGITAGIVALTIGELRAASNVGLGNDQIEFVNRLGRKHEVKYTRIVSYRRYRMPGGQKVMIFFYRPSRWIFGLSPLTVTEEVGQLILGRANVPETSSLRSF